MVISSGPHAAFWGSGPMVALLCYLKQDAEAKCYLPGAPFSRQLCWCSLVGPSGQAIVPHWPDGVSLPRCPFIKDSSPMSPQRCFQDCTASDTWGYQRALMKGFLALLAKQTPTVLLFFELLLIPGSAAQLLNQPVSKPWGSQEGCLWLVAPIL